MPKRVLLAGLFHETHTFLDWTTGLADFAVRRRDELFDAAGDGSPLSGVLQVAASCSWEVRPVIDLRTTPSAIVDDAVFTLFWDEFAAAYAGANCRTRRHLSRAARRNGVSERPRCRRRTH